MSAPMTRSIRYVGKKPMDFCVVTPLPEMADYAEEMARQMGIATCVALSGLENDVDVALEVIRNENVRMLATRGYTEYFLRRKTSVPILSIGYSAENFFETLLPYQNSGITVGHICFPGQGHRFMKIANLLGLEGKRLEIEDRNEVYKMLYEPRSQGISLFIGGLGVISRVRGHGFNGIPLLAETREVVSQTFQDAQAMLAIIRINEDRNHFIQTIQDTNPNIIIYVDHAFTISYANKSAMDSFAFMGHSLVGAHLEALFPCADFSVIFADSLDKHEPGLLTDRFKRDYLFEITEINPHGGPAGYILSFNSVHNLQRSERVLRKKQPPISRYSIDDIAGSSDAIKCCKRLAARYAASDEPVLIMGETGTGKELFAQAIHGLSSRGKNAFIALNCASLSETLMESELFGYEDGAFTNARRGGKQGLLELASGGTLFLDEIGEMPLALQARLLRVLQDQIIMRVGGTRLVALDVRIICATNRNLAEMLRSGAFRQDLYFRINTLPLAIPPLSGRKEDIALIAEKFARDNKTRISPRALARLASHNWQGNARELLHILKRAKILSENKTIDEKNIIFDNEFFYGSGPQAEKAQLLAALEKNAYNRGAAARELGISRTNLWKKMKKLDIK